jgi:hypothetical protein
MDKELATGKREGGKSRGRERKVEGEESKKSQSGEKRKKILPCTLHLIPVRIHKELCPFLPTSLFFFFPSNFFFHLWWCGKEGLVVCNYAITQHEQ